MEDKKEKLYLTAIQNLIKKNNFNKLHNQLDKKRITEDEYLKEINNYPEKYILQTNNMNDPNDLFFIKEIVEKLDSSIFVDELRTDEVADLFSVTSESIEDSLEKLKEKDENS